MGLLDKKSLGNGKEELEVPLNVDKLLDGMVSTVKAFLRRHFPFFWGVSCSLRALPSCFSWRSLTFSGNKELTIMLDLLAEWNNFCWWRLTKQSNSKKAMAVTAMMDTPIPAYQIGRLLS